MATDTSCSEAGQVQTQTVEQASSRMGTLRSPGKQDMAPIEEAEDGEEQEPEREEEMLLRRKLDGPVDDLDVAASYAELEIQSMASQFAATVVDVTKAKPRCETADADDDEEGEGLAAMVGKPLEHQVANENESETEEEEDEALHASSSDESSDDEDEEEAARQRKLREEIEQSLEQDATTEPPKTANEVAETDVPVRKPTVEITPESRLARCGTILSMNEKSLMATVTSDSGENALAEGSVLCLSDRSVLGCVDEVFGPVLMPMYLVRFEAADQIPKLAEIGQPVFFVTEASTYLQPELLHTKGSDASNLYDEEADDAVYSDDETEANAKRQLQHRKRNRVDSAPAQLQDLPQTRSRSSSGGFFVDYQPPQPTGRQRTGSGAWRGPGRNHGRGHHGFRGFFQPIQAQPQGGITRYTSPGFVPGTMSNYPSQPPMPPPPPYGGVYGASYLPGGLSPQYGYPQYFEPPQQRGRYPPTFYAGPAPPLPPDAAENQNNGFFEPNGQQYPPPPPHPSSYEYGR